jgi:hypothetical protein
MSAMRTPAPLPDDLRGRPFARRHGEERTGAGRLRRRDIARPFHGVLVDAPLTDLPALCRAYSVRMKEGQAFSHVTAARLHGLAVPSRLEADLPLHVCAVMPAPAPQTREVVGHRLRIAPPVVELDGLLVVQAAEAWCQLAGLLTVEELVVAADQLLNRGWSPKDQLELLRARAGAQMRSGAQRLGRALTLTRSGSASPAESLVRVALVQAGLPEPELNAPVLDSRGRVLGHGDLVWRRQRVVLEYEGDQHRTDRGQFRYDIERYERFREAGWTVIRVTADDLRLDRRASLAARVRRALS